MGAAWARHAMCESALRVRRTTRVGTRPAGLHSMSGRDDGEVHRDEVLRMWSCIQLQFDNYVQFIYDVSQHLAI
jgi:hypothetical protein